jgi:hypothetical protein
MGEVNKEIEEMLNGLGDPTPESLKDEEEEKQDEEDPEKKEEVEEKEEEEKEDTSEKKEEESPEKKEEEEEVDKDAIIDNLRKQLNERLGPVSEKEAEKKESEPLPKKEEEPLKFEDQDFVGDLDLDDLTHDKTVLNKLLNAVYSKGVTDSKKIATEKVLNSIPDIVKHNLTILTSLKEVSDNFYNENKDLVPFKRVVAAVFEEVASKNPDKKYGELMELVGPEVRTRLALHKQAVKEEKKEEERKPRLPNAKGGPRHSPETKPNTSAISNEIAEMNKALGR